jgi:phosphatidylinositol alpha-1,6-mannosyltransferase
VRDTRTSLSTPRRKNRSTNNSSGPGLLPGSMPLDIACKASSPPWARVPTSTGVGSLNVQEEVTTADTPPIVLALVSSAGRGGGIESYADAVLEQAARLGVAPHRVVLTDLRSRRGSSRLAKLAFSLRTLATAVQTRRESRPVVILAMLPAFAPLALLARWATGSRQTRVLVFFYGADAWGRGRVTSLICRRPEVEMVTISSFSAGALSSLGSAAVLPPGIPAGRYQALLAIPAKPFPPKGETIAVLSVFRLESAESKGAFGLIDAINCIRDGGVAMRLVIAGVGGASRELLREVEQRSTWVTLVPSPTETELVRMYAAGDLFVLASRFRSGSRPSGEGFGIVLAEAALAGMPVIAPARDGSTAAYLPGITGIRPADESPQSLAAALLWCAKCPSQVTNLGHNARTWATECFNPDRYRQQVADLLELTPSTRPWDLGLKLVGPPHQSDSSTADGQRHGTQ